MLRSGVLGVPKPLAFQRRTNAVYSSVHQPLTVRFRAKGTWAASNTQLQELAIAPITPVTLTRLLDLGESVNFAESSLLVHSELPKRLARRVKVVRLSDFLLSYLDSFETLSNLPKPIDGESMELFASTLRDLVASHGDVIPRLAKGFHECGKYMSKEDSAEFLDGMIHARIAIRGFACVPLSCSNLFPAHSVLAEHHLALQDPTAGHIGVLNTNLSPLSLLKNTANYVHELCEINYGVAPDCEFFGHLDTRITYISNHLEYIFMELLKNAYRATVEHHAKNGRLRVGDEVPPVQITIARGPDDVTIRIRDRGGGIPPEEMLRVFEYSYTTVPKSELEEEDLTSNIFSSQSRQAMQVGVGGPIAGLGFGLPMSRIYAKYFGGSLELKSVGGHGLDVFLRVPNISRSDSKKHVI
ncbi:hypothetical protein HDU82_007745 [Entophlyctis luteolus]|nr:hypothetical protein HDU82_007745 [Entophlyctis luteolus]